ncbi:MAG: acyltransferase family protein [Halioglobus sp.]
MNYRPEVDGLRAVAVLPVIVFHTGLTLGGMQLLPGGYIGVDVFFVISGYLIASILCQELNDGQFSFAGFYERRARRILPALCLMLVVCLPAAWQWMDAASLKNLGWSLSAVSLFLSNFLYWSRSGYFAVASESDPLLHTWSLAVEEQFYFLFPVLLWLLWRLGVRRMTGIFLLLLAASLFAAVTTDSRHTAFYWPHTRAWELLAGVVLAVNRSSIVSLHRYRVLPALAPLTGLLLIILSVFMLDKNSGVPGWAALGPVLGTCLILAFAGGTDLGTRILGHRLLVGIGLISYALYLWHQPLFAFLRLYCDLPPALWQYLMVVLAAFVCAGASYRFIEQPLRNRSLFSRNTIAVGAVVGTLALVGVGCAMVINEGYPGRWSAEHNALSEYQHYKYKAMVRDKTCLLHPRQSFDDLGDNCFAQDDSELVLWGDSHAATLYPGFSEAVGSGRVTQMTTARCPPILDLEGFNLPNCVDNNRRAFEAVIRNMEARIFLLAIWSLYIPPEGVSFGYYAEDYWRKLERTLSELSRAGVQVTVIGGFPVWYPTLPQRLAKIYRVEGVVPDYLPLPTAPDVHAVDVELATITRRHGHRFVSVIDHLCPGGVCPVKVPGKSGGEVLIQWDSSHPTREGGKLISRQILEAVNLP